MTAPSAPQGGGVLWVGGQPDETGMWAAYATREECLSHCASATPYTVQPRTDTAPLATGREAVRATLASRSRSTMSL